MSRAKQLADSLILRSLQWTMRDSSGQFCINREGLAAALTELGVGGEIGDGLLARAQRVLRVSDLSAENQREHALNGAFTGYDEEREEIVEHIERYLIGDLSQRPGRHTFLAEPQPQEY